MIFSLSFQLIFDFFSFTIDIYSSFIVTSSFFLDLYVNNYAMISILPIFLIFYNGLYTSIFIEC